MQQTPPIRLPAPLERATQRVRQAACRAVEQTIDGLGLAAMAASQLLQRDALLGAQYELGRKAEVFAGVFNEHIATEAARQAGLLTPSPVPGLTPEQLVASWESLTLMADSEVELHISAERVAMGIASSCEWELREFDAYMATLLSLPAADHGRNPLRPEVVAQAMVRGVDAVSGRPEVRQVLANHLGRAFGQLMRNTYAELVAELRASGVRPAGMLLKASSGHGSSRPGSLGPATGEPHPSETAATPFGRSGHDDLGEPSGPRSRPQFLSSGPRRDSPPRRNTMGRVSEDMMGTLRRLARSEWPEPARSTDPAEGAAAPVGDDDWMDDAAAQGGVVPPRAGGFIAPNLIHAHRAELRQWAGGPVDHLVIDLVGSLFDQILSDNQVPPQFARQIARLQLPVLRAALGDPDFFASRRHPVRRFVNRIASLGAACDAPEHGAGAALLARVAELVQAVVEGEFDDAALYEQQLQALEQFVAEQAQAELQALGQADTVLARKEAELLAQQRFAQALDQGLRELPVPDYLREFVAQVWGRAIARVVYKEGPGSPLAQHLRDTGRELLMSVQPKGSPLLRQQFLARLPNLMKDWKTGMDHARCLPDDRRALFAKLLPAHAEALKAPPLSTLEHNLLAKRIEAVLAAPVPKPEDLAGPAPAAAAALLQAAANDQGFTPAEAQAVGLVAEQAVDWQAELDIDLSEEPELTAVDIAIDGLPPPEAPLPSRGASLADHVQIGFAYQMQIDGAWRKVRLTHVSPGRSFFIFTHGQRQRQAVSMTHRMLVRLCDAGRLRAFECAYLLERATARARRQLAELGQKAH